jgi:predicted Zn finger-like uncharacterized protein
MKTQCPNCKSKFNANETSVGKQAKCPKCGNPFTIQPFIETPASPRGEPVVVETPVKSPEPVTPPALSSVLSGVALAKTEATAKSEKSPEPIKPPVTIPKPVETPVTKIAEPVKKEEKPESKAASKTLSKTVFVYCWMAVRIIAGVLGALGLMLAIRKGAHSTLIAAFAAADVFLVCSVLIELALFYKMWAAIQDDQASMSPAKAIGFLFIPVFNIYWALLMITGFAEDYNAFIRRRSVKTSDLPMSLFLIYAFVFILAATVLTIPMICVFAFVGRIRGAFIGHPLASWVLFFVAFAAGVAHFISYILVAIKTCNAINALPERKGG